jgi:hypothetical protein
VWCNTGPWLPRIRTEKEVCDYYLRKEKINISKAKETYTTKVEVGDRGDNLLPGTPLRLFDLWEEDEEWGWSPEEVELLMNMSNVTTPTNRIDHLEKSKQYLISIGMFLPENPLPTEYDKRVFFEKAKIERAKASHPELKGLNRKYCIELEDSQDLEKCKKIAIQDGRDLEEIKSLESRKKEDPDSFSDQDSLQLRLLKDRRKDNKASLLRYNSKQIVSRQNARQEESCLSHA